MAFQGKELKELRAHSLCILVTAARHWGHVFLLRSAICRAVLSNKCPHGVIATFSMVISSMVMGQASFFAMAASTNALNMWRGICWGCASSLAAAAAATRAGLAAGAAAGADGLGAAGADGLGAEGAKGKSAPRKCHSRRLSLPIYTS